MSAFGRTARARQGAFRNTSDTVSEAGRSPQDTKGKRNPHLLAVGQEEENLFPSLRGGSGARHFFSERHIKWWRSSRSGDATGVDGPTRNLASSQIACVNFLLPLATVPGALCEMLSALDQGVREVVPLYYKEFRSLVEFEWIGLERPLEQGAPFTRGANATSADALIVGVTDSGRRRAYLFEWKYVEEYQVGRWLGKGSAGDTRRRRYEELFRAPDSPFRLGVGLEDLLYEPLYQLARLLLLGRKMVQGGEFGVREARVVVVCPRENLAYRTRVTSPQLAEQFPNATTVHGVMRQLLKNPAELIPTSQEDLLNALRGSAVAARLDEWLRYQKDRYGW